MDPWCPCRAWRPPCPPGRRPGREARQGRKVNTWGSLRPRVDWSLSGAICNIFFYHYFYFIFKIRFSCHWNISGESFLLSPTLSWAYWPTVSRDNPLFLFSLTGGQDDHLLHSLKKVLKELVSNKTMFGCFSPFKIGTHSSLKTSDWTNLKRKYFWKCVGSIYFWLSHSGKKFEAKFEFWKVSNIWTLL